MTIPPVSRRLLIGSAAASLLGLTSCRGPATPEGPPAPSGGSSAAISGTVTHWDTWQSQTAYIKNEIDIFHKQTGVTINRTQQQTGAYTNLLTLGAKSGDLPDVRYSGSDPALNAQVSNGWLLPLNDHLDDAFVKSFPPYTFVEGSNMFDGKVYSVPFEGNTAPWIFLFINNKVFKDAGLVDAGGAVLIPRTWDEVTQYAKQITERGKGKVFGLGFGNSAFDLLSWWAALFCQSDSPSGAFGIDLRTGKYVMGSEPVGGEFLELLRGWKDAGLVFPSSMSVDDETARVYFAKGDFGMTVGGVWNQPGWAADGFTDYSITTLVGRTPEPKAKFYSAPGGSMWVVNSKTRNLDAAVAWFRHLYGLPAGERWTQEFALGLSIHPEAVKLDAVKDQNFKNYIAAIEGKQIAGPQPTIKNPLTAKVLPDAVKPGVGDVLAGVYTGQIKDIGAALTDLEKRMNASHEKAVETAAKKGIKVSNDDWVFSDWNPLEPYKYDIPEYPKL